MRTRRMSYALFVFVLLAAVLSACGAAPTATPTAAPPTATKAPVAAPTNTAAPAPAAPTATKAAAAPTATTAAAAPTATKAAATTPAAGVTPTAGPTATPIPMACTKLASAYTPAAGQLGAPDKPITITFVPSGDTGKITRAGTAIADCLTKMTGLTYKIEVGTTFAASIEAMGANKAQVGFLATFSILLAQQKYGVEPALVALRKYNTNAIDPDKADAGKLTPYYKGQFIANKASNVKTIADLKGKTFCFVDPNSTSGFIIPDIILKANGINKDKDLKGFQNAGSHPNVAVAVYKGDCDAGATFVDVLTDTAADLKSKYPDIQDKVTAFYISDRLPNDGVQYTKDLDAKIKSITTEGMLAMAADPGGLAQLKALYNYDGFQKIDATYYNDFASILKKAGVDPAELVK